MPVFGFALLFCLGIGVITLWLTSMVMIWLGRVRADRISTRAGWLLMIPGIVLCLLTTLFIGTVGYGYWEVNRPLNVFKDAFGFEATPDVHNLQADYYYFMDTGYTFLRFHASAATVGRIVARGLSENRAATMPSTSIKPPSWWQLPVDSPAIRYTGNFDGRDFAWEQELLIYYPDTEAVFFYFIGID